MAQRFEPKTPLAKAIYNGDSKAVVAFLGPMSRAERERLRDEALRLNKLMEKAHDAYGDRTYAGWGSDPGFPQYQAGAAAMFLCGTAKDLEHAYWKMKDLLPLARKYPPPWIEDWGEDLDTADDIQALIAAKLIKRPTGDHYPLALMGLFSGRRGEAPTVDAAFKADPGLKDVLLRVMEIEGTQETSLASLDKYRSSPVSWAERLKTLSEKGVYKRAVLIDKALAALERGWNQFRSGWFSSFHVLLKPTAKEMKPHAGRYLALLGSRTPPNVTFALECVVQLEAASAMDARELLDGLRPVFVSAVKGHVETGLRIVDRAVNQDAKLALQAAQLIVPALGHPAASLQKQVLARIGQWDAKGALRGSLAPYAKGIAAVNRDAFRALAGQKDAPAPKAPERNAAPASRAPAIPLDANHAVAPIETLDELVDRVAYALENEADAEEFERALAGLARFAPFDEATRARFAAVAKRIPKITRTVPQQLAAFLNFLMSGARFDVPEISEISGLPNLLQRHLAQRVGELMRDAGKVAGNVPLATPTHRHGYIDSMELAKRLAARAKQGVPVGRIDFLSALMRIEPRSAGTALAAARKLGDDEHALALRCALGDEVKVRDRVLSDAARRMRALVGGLGAKARTWRVEKRKFQSGKAWTTVTVDRPDPDDSRDPVSTMEREAQDIKLEYWFEVAAVANLDEGSIGHYATLLPADPENFFAEGAEIISRNIDWWQAQWHNKAYLRPLLSPAVRMGPMATLLLALGLAGKEPGQTAVAVDALVQSTLEGRLDAKLLGATVAQLVRDGHTSCARHAKSLSAALRIDEAVAPVAAEVAFAVIAARPADPPKDTAALLDLLLELVHGEGVVIPAETRAALESLEIGGKGKSLRKQLLA